MTIHRYIRSSSRDTCHHDAAWQFSASPRPDCRMPHARGPSRSSTSNITPRDRLTIDLASVHCPSQTPAPAGEHCLPLVGSLGALWWSPCRSRRWTQPKVSQVGRGVKSQRIDATSAGVCQALVTSDYPREAVSGRVRPRRSLMKRELRWARAAVASVALLMPIMAGVPPTRGNSRTRLRRRPTPCRHTR